MELYEAVSRAGSGSQEAIKYLYRLYAARVYLLCLEQLGDEKRARSATARCLIRAMRGARAPERFEALLERRAALACGRLPFGLSLPKAGKAPPDSVLGEVLESLSRPRMSFAMRLTVLAAAALVVGYCGAELFDGEHETRAVVETGGYHIVTQTGGAGKIEALPASEAESVDLMININAATAAELEWLPGVGEKTAQSIVAYREEHGPFAAVEDIMNVPGIAEKKLAAMKDMITVK